MSLIDLATTTLRKIFIMPDTNNDDLSKNPRNDPDWNLVLDDRARREYRRLRVIRILESQPESSREPLPAPFATMMANVDTAAKTTSSLCHFFRKTDVGTWHLDTSNHTEEEELQIILVILTDLATVGMDMAYTIMGVRLKSFQFMDAQHLKNSLEALVNRQNKVVKALCHSICQRPTLPAFESQFLHQKALDLLINFEKFEKQLKSWIKDIEGMPAEFAEYARVEALFDAPFDVEAAGKEAESKRSE